MTAASPGFNSFRILETTVALPDPVPPATPTITGWAEATGLLMPHRHLPALRLESTAQTALASSLCFSQYRNPGTPGPVRSLPAFRAKAHCVRFEAWLPPERLGPVQAPGGQSTHSVPIQECPRRQWRSLECGSPWPR